MFGYINVNEIACQPCLKQKKYIYMGEIGNLLSFVANTNLSEF